MNRQRDYDVIVIGAGAAGLLAAARAAARGRRVLLLEKNRKAGVKILMSGGARCNITQETDAAGIIAAFGPAGRFLHSPLAAFSPRALRDFFHAQGVPTKVEASGKVFPVSDKAVDVRDALVAWLRRAGGELSLAEAVTDLRREGDGFVVETSHGWPGPTTFRRRLNVAQFRRRLDVGRVIVTTGGRSYPGCGTTGDGYAWLATMGHAIRPPRPALTPLTSHETWLQGLAGVTLPDVSLSVWPPLAKKPPAQKPRPAIVRRGSLLFTHFGLSGPAAMDVSREVTKAASARGVVLQIDFLPDVTDQCLKKQLAQSLAAFGKRLIAHCLPEALPKSLASALVHKSSIPSDRRASQFSKPERLRLLANLKACEVILSGTRGFGKAEVTAGGVDLAEVDSRNMQSKLVPGLFLAGEILDLDGFIGGYNFQAAFSTGYLAGSSV